MDKDKIKTLPVEVELALDVMPCQAMRRGYDGAPKPHACAHFAEWGVLHSYDYDKAGPPPGPGIVQPSTYAGKRPVIPEILSGCRKAPILAVGINPNLPGWQERDRNAIHPYFDDYLQYAHYFRWRARDKMRIPKEKYTELLSGRPDDPAIGEPLIEKGSEIEVERMPVKMYEQYQTLLDGLATEMGWADHKLAVGEDLAYANMVACGGARWTTTLPAGGEGMPLMGVERGRAIVKECFDLRAHFPRQLLQSLPAAVIVFSQATADAFIARLGRHFIKGDPLPGEKLAALLKREFRMKLGTTRDGEVIDTRVIFSPHASANPDQFAAARNAIIAHLKQEADAGRIDLNPDTGHLRRPRGGCLFCENAFYSIGSCDYRDELRPLSLAGAGPLADAVGSISAAERAEHVRLLEDFMRPDRSTVVPGDMVVLDDAAPFAPRLILHGTIATMRAGADAVIEDGALFLHAGRIVAVGRRGDPAPAAFTGITPIETNGVIFPGLADLHNHLAYNILSLWFPKSVTQNRSQWLSNPDYKSKVGKVMDVVANRQDLLRALIRYVEAKLLIGGVTSGQGMVTKFGGSPLFQGLVRNFEEPGDPHLAAIRHRVPDLKVQDIPSFRGALLSGAQMLFHLAEGTNQRARDQFKMLADNDLVKANLVGVHSLGLTDADVQTLVAAGAGIVWSPLSNWLLYGRTLDPNVLVQSQARFALGSDWTPSGSRNILCEMKVAFLAAQAAGAPIDAERLAQAVTRDAMQLVGWQDSLGTLEPDKYADLTVVTRRAGMSAFESLLKATEADIQLVVVAGHARFGERALMRAAVLDPDKLENLQVGGQAKAIDLDHPSSPLNGLSLAKAKSVLEMALADLPAARDAALFEPQDDSPRIEVELDLVEVEAEAAAEAGDVVALAEIPLPQSVPLDPLTVIDDAGFWATLDAIEHLPFHLKGADGLKKFYKP
ncbi:hypothetical protein E0H35_30540 [Rhizobium leguminosarum bv. viciae]|uniref:amidohydrolase family protein n=1 Tax=Rhizobium leguminosarum TaxID=384 RepID=UPI00103A6316|nr:amidohydrolase family protein [Rhizobium leguminosarum]MBY5340433.1 amidohydrolase family protein [Rhizobium leguminosarum]NKK49333.1 amidohydrolase family protein [Rhizobium leguminosarum bv. viciae]TBY90873.1 hypothetical protein E0H35_30540 [Rhizobium leguminosarum bv. viciae]